MTAKEKDNEMSIYDMADKFIALANDIVEHQDVGRVGTAMRYATARFNAHEAALKAKTLSTEKDSAIKWFSEQFIQMLGENIDVHIDLQQQALKDHEDSCDDPTHNH